MLSDHDLRDAFEALRVETEQRAVVPRVATVLHRRRRVAPLAVVVALGTAMLGTWATVGLVTAASSPQVVISPVPSGSAQTVPDGSVAPPGPSPTYHPTSRPSGTGDRAPAPVETPTGQARGSGAGSPAGRGTAAVVGTGAGTEVGTPAGPGGGTGAGGTGAGPGVGTGAGTGPTPAGSTGGVPAGPQASTAPAQPAPSTAASGQPTDAPSTEPVGSRNVVVWLLAPPSGSGCGVLVPVSRTVTGVPVGDSQASAALRAVLDGVTPAEAARGYTSPFSPAVLADATVTIVSPTQARIDLASMAALQAIPLVCRSNVALAVQQTATSAGVVSLTISVAGSPANFSLWLLGG